MDVLVVGLGYVGLTAAVGLAAAGHQVLGVDTDPAKVRLLQAGRVPFYEPGVDDLLRQVLENGCLRFDVADRWEEHLREIVIVAVGTPQRSNGSADLSQVRTVVDQVCQVAKSPVTLVMKSTVPPGTGDELQVRYLNQAHAPVNYVSNPEFLREGRALDDWFKPDRVVVGAGDLAQAEKVARLYEDLHAPCVITSVTNAELIKYAANAFLATKISFINEVASVCEVLGADVTEVARGLGLDRRIGQDFLKAGIGYGGSCFPKDTAALDFLAASHGYHFQLLRSAIEVNSRQRLWPLRQLRQVIGSLGNRTVGVLGLAFKPHTDDLREAPAMELVPLLVEEGAHVRVYDPVALTRARGLLPETVTLCERAFDVVNGADAVVITTEWPEFVNLDWADFISRMQGPKLVVDGRNCLEPTVVRSAGGRYVAVGRR